MHDSSSCTGVPEKVAKLLNAHAKHTYADCAVDYPQTEAPLLQIPEVVKTPPRTALATAKRKEVYSSRVWAAPPRRRPFQPWALSLRLLMRARCCNLA